MHVEDEPTGLQDPTVVAGEGPPSLVRGLVPGAAACRGKLLSTAGAGMARLARVRLQEGRGDHAAPAYPQVLLQALLGGENFATLAAAFLLVSGESLADREHWAHPSHLHPLT